ncbi:MAG: L-2-amino-thiazoline-4-carboxylic acid hydrolase, partial [Candidatus Thorarchaeota archaeon]
MASHVFLFLVTRLVTILSGSDTSRCMKKDVNISRAVIWDRLQEVRSAYDNLEKLKPLVEKWEEDFGPEHQNLVDELIATASSNYWNEMAAREGHSLDDLIRTLWESWDEGEYTSENIPDGVQVYVTKCPMADAFRAIGRVDLGVQFFCNEDEHIVAGFNPSIKFSRTKTLM